MRCNRKMKFATGIEYHLKRGVREKFLKGGKVQKSELECLVKEKARICEAKSAFVKPYPAKPERAEHTGRIRHRRIGCDYKKNSQKV